MMKSGGTKINVNHPGCFRIPCPLCKGHKEVVVARDDKGRWRTVDFEEFEAIVEQERAEKRSRGRKAKEERQD